MSIPRLIFYPTNPRQAVEPEALLSALRGLGFIDAPLAESAARSSSYGVGPRFLDLLTFLGCSPNIALGPEDGDKFCHVGLETYTEARLIAGPQPLVPRCRHCKAPLEDWRAQLNPDLPVDEQSITCGKCGEATALHRLNWRHSAAVARQFLVVYHIYLHEAVPGEALLQTLQSVGAGTEWDYFYAL